MRNAYALLGLSFAIVFTGAYILFKQSAEAPTNLTTPTNTSTMSLTLSSIAFDHNETIPAPYTCDGENISPPLQITGVPEGTESLVLVMDDPDIPKEIQAEREILKFDHWVVYNLPPDTTDLPEGVANLTEGLNSAGTTSYRGACPPPEYEPSEHRYVFRLYALSGTLNFIKEPTLNEVETAAEGMTIERAELIGRYSRVTD